MAQDVKVIGKAASSPCRRRAIYAEFSKAQNPKSWDVEPEQAKAIEAINKGEAELVKVADGFGIKPKAKPKKAKTKSQGKVKKNVNKARATKQDSG